MRAADFWDGFMGLAIFVCLTAAAVWLGRVAESGGRTSYRQAGALGVGMGLLALTMVAAHRFHYRDGALSILAASVALPFIATGVTDRHSLPVRWLLIVYAGSCVWMLFRWYRGSSTSLDERPLASQSVRPR